MKMMGLENVNFQICDFWVKGRPSLMIFCVPESYGFHNAILDKSHFGQAETDREFCFNGNITMKVVPSPETGYPSIRG